MSLLSQTITYLKGKPSIWNVLQKAKTRYVRIKELSYFFYDIKNTYKSMYWPKEQKCIDTLSAELVFQYHKLEKGLVMPPPRRMFGINPASETMRLLDDWQRKQEDNINDPIFLAGVGTLQCYSDHIKKYELDKEDTISTVLDSFLNKHLDQRSLYSTPSLKTDYYNPQEFKELSLARRSVRQFIDKTVPKNIIIQSYEVAQQAPSACNRQPCSIKVVSDPKLKKEMLRYQNGNSGFGHLIPSVVVITANEKYFFGGIERHQPYIDGGLFSMSFILGLQSHGVSSCCLNWCVTPKKDKIVHELLKIDKSERIIMYLAIGYAPNELPVATSTRRTSHSTVKFIDDSSES